MRSSPLWFRICAASAILLLGGPVAIAQVADPSTTPSATNRIEQLRSLKLEDLLKREVTSVSKRPEKLFQSAAAVSSISSEDIRRSGARSFPDALRLVPGVNAAQINANEWAVSIRGFNDQYSKNLLVLRDGRTLYSPIFNGVFWGLQDYLLEDIDRIEVVRGPGGTLWGANAVNGVINIMTKDAKDTQGVYAEGGAGSEERGFAGGRYGVQLSDNTYGRVYGQYRHHDNFSGGNDSSDFAQGGFRTDWDVDQAHLTVSGDAYVGYFNSLSHSNSVTAPLVRAFKDEAEDVGGNFLARFERKFSSESALQLQAYYDRAAFETDVEGTHNTQQILDFDLQHRFPLPGRQQVVYGLGYRYFPTKLEDTFKTTFSPNNRDQQLFSGFVQDEIGVVEDRLNLILGTKVEHNDYTGWETQPSGRLVWTPTERQTYWGSVSRAVQVPARVFRDIAAISLPSQATTADTPFGPLPVFVSGRADPNLDSQELIAYELGYRFQPADQWSFDVAGFYNVYDRLITGKVGTPYFDPAPAPHLVVPVTGVNGGKGDTYGFELEARYNVSEWWRLVGTYSYLRFDLDPPSAGEGNDPRHTVGLRSSMDLPGNIHLDLWGRYVSNLTAQNIPEYFDLDVRLAWRPNQRWEFALVGQNLIETQRYEFTPGGTVGGGPIAVPWGFYGQVSARF